MFESLFALHRRFRRVFAAAQFALSDSRFSDCGCALVKRKSTANRFTTIREADGVRDNAIRESVETTVFTRARRRTSEKKRNDNGLAPRPRHCWKRVWWIPRDRVAPSVVSLSRSCPENSPGLAYESEVKSRFSGNIRRRNWYELGETVLARLRVFRKKEMGNRFNTGIRYSSERIENQTSSCLSYYRVLQIVPFSFSCASAICTFKKKKKREETF